MCNKYRLVHECGHWTTQTRSLCSQAQARHNWRRRAPGDECPNVCWLLDEHLRLKCTDCHRKWRKTQATILDNRRKQAMHLALRYPRIKQAIHERYVEEKSYFLQSLPQWEAETENGTGRSVYNRYPAEIERAFSGFVDLFHRMKEEMEIETAATSNQTGNQTDYDSEWISCPGSFPDASDSGSTCSGTHISEGSNRESDRRYSVSGGGVESTPSGSQSRRRPATLSSMPLEGETGGSSSAWSRRRSLDQESNYPERRRGWNERDFSAWFQAMGP